MEVTGLVLGGFPLLIGALKTYPETAKTFREWRRFRTAIEGYADTLDTQRMIYWDRVLELLVGVVPPEELKQLYQGHGIASLSDIDGSDLVLEQRLGASKYDLFQKHSRRIESSLEDIKKLLRMDDNKKIPWEKGGFIKRERGKFLLVVNKTELSDTFTRIREANADLEALIKRNVIPYLGAANRVHKAYYHEDVPLMRRRVKSLHKAITSSQRWKCPCSQQHTICITLGEIQRAREGTNTKTKLLISFRPPSCATGTIPHNAWHAVEARFVDSQTGTNVDKPVLQEIPAQNTQSKPFAKPSKKGVMFMLPKPKLIPLAISEELQLPDSISDLCETLRLAREKALEGQIGCLEDKTESCQHLLYSGGLVPSHIEMIPLRGVLERSKLHQHRLPHQQQPNELLWEESLQLATQLALGILRMEGSWIKGELRTEDILFDRSHHEPSIQDIISREDSSPKQAKSVLPLVARLIRSDALFSLGLVLVELAFGCLLEDLRIADDIDSNERLRDLKTATRLLPNVRGNRGPRYQQVIESCLFVPPDIKCVDLDDEQFQRYVLVNVVSPLVTDLDVLFDLGI